MRHVTEGLSPEMRIAYDVADLELLRPRGSQWPKDPDGVASALAKEILAAAKALNDGSQCLAMAHLASDLAEVPLRSRGRRDASTAKLTSLVAILTARAKDLSERKGSAPMVPIADAKRQASAAAAAWKEDFEALHNDASSSALAGNPDPCCAPLWVADWFKDDADLSEALSAGGPAIDAKSARFSVDGQCETLCRTMAWGIQYRERRQSRGICVAMPVPSSEGSAG